MKSYNLQGHEARCSGWEKDHRMAYLTEHHGYQWRLMIEHYDRLKADIVPPPEEDETPKKRCRAITLEDEDSPSTEKIVAVIGSDTLYEKDMEILKDPRGWLNDKIINAYFRLLQEDLARTHPGKMIMMDSFLYPALQNHIQRREVYQDIVDEAMKQDPFSYDWILFPIHLHSHWTLAIVNLPLGYMYYSDSLNQSSKTVFRDIQRFLPERTCWRTIHLRDSVPQQTNSWDCGVFVCTMAKFIMLRLHHGVEGAGVMSADFPFNQSEMPRRRMNILRSLQTKTID